MLAQAFFQTTTFSYFLPDLLKEFPHGRLLDIRCGLSKNFLQGKFDEIDDHHGIHASQVKFHEGNNLEFDVGLGCGMFVYMGEYTFSSKLKEQAWKNWRSFYFHGSGATKLKFVASPYGNQVIKAVIEEGTININ